MARESRSNEEGPKLRREARPWEKPLDCLFAMSPALSVSSQVRRADRSRPATEEGRRLAADGRRMVLPVTASSGARSPAAQPGDSLLAPRATSPFRRPRAVPSSRFDRARPPPRSIPYRVPSGRSSSRTLRTDRAAWRPKSDSRRGRYSLPARRSPARGLPVRAWGADVPECREPLGSGVVPGGPRGQAEKAGSPGRKALVARAHRSGQD
jgi:hypothetical protein